jgi:hypothetical protein
MEKFQEVFDEVKAGVKQKSSSKKDEVTIMKALMNDSDYSTKIYGTKDGVDTHYPSQELRKVVANAVSEITKIPAKEATELVKNYEFTKSDAQTMVNFSKEFVYSYLQTGRKLPLGGRVESDVELIWKNIGARNANIPNSSGKSVIIPEHGGIRAINKIPSWAISDEFGKVIGTTYGK